MDPGKAKSKAYTVDRLVAFENIIFAEASAAEVGDNETVDSDDAISGDVHATVNDARFNDGSLIVMFPETINLVSPLIKNVPVFPIMVKKLLAERDASRENGTADTTLRVTYDVAVIPLGPDAFTWIVNCEPIVIVLGITTVRDVVFTAINATLHWRATDGFNCIQDHE